jgi:aspartate carbamoyltransferase regulatory subunit
MKLKELKVAALKNGTVIDHIPSDKLFKVASILQVEKCGSLVTLGNNLESKQLGLKGIIKVSDRFFEKSETNKIALLAPNAKINIIRDYEVVEKRSLTLPREIPDIVQCGNPNCITNHQSVATRFFVIKNGDVRLKCRYCEREMKQEEVKIK